jgi:hypothetical protein
MAIKRIHIGVSPAQLKVLEKLSTKLGLDITNTIRYCVSRIADQETIVRDRPGRTGGT